MASSAIKEQFPISPTQHLPGSEEKKAVLAARARQEMPLFDPADRTDTMAKGATRKWSDENAMRFERLISNKGGGERAMARYTYKGTKYYLGCYDTEEEAARVVKRHRDQMIREDMPEKRKKRYRRQFGLLWFCADECRFWQRLMTMRLIVWKKKPVVKPRVRWVNISAMASSTISQEFQMAS